MRIILFSLAPIQNKSMVFTSTIVSHLPTSWEFKFPLSSGHLCLCCLCWWGRSWHVATLSSQLLASSHYSHAGCGLSTHPTPPQPTLALYPVPRGCLVWTPPAVPTPCLRTPAHHRYPHRVVPLGHQCTTATQGSPRLPRVRRNLLILTDRDVTVM